MNGGPGLPEPGQSWAVLAGFGRYTHLDDLPAVTANLDDLAAALQEPAIWGLPPDRCTVVRDGATQRELLRGIADAGRRIGERGALLVYYAGHGLIEAHSGEFYVALSDSERDEVDDTAVRFEMIRKRVLESAARRRVVILDCCYSGRAMGEMSSDEVVDKLEIDQSVILAAASRTAVALAPPGERHTAFTGELLTVLRDGIQHGPPLLSTATVLQKVRVALRAKGRPIPECRSRNAGDNAAFVRNAWRPTQVPAVRQPPAPPKPRPPTSLTPKPRPPTSLTPTRGRPVEPLEGYGPTADFAHLLRAARDTAGNPSYDAMGRLANTSKTTMSDTDRGRRMPRWDNVELYLHACGVPPADFSTWRKTYDTHCFGAAGFRPDLSGVYDRPALHATLDTLLVNAGATAELLLEHRADASLNGVPRHLHGPVPSAADLMAEPRLDTAVPWLVFLAGGTVDDAEQWRARLSFLPDPPPQLPTAPASAPAPSSSSWITRMARWASRSTPRSGP